jgi:outer membrane protein TolC
MKPRQLLRTAVALLAMAALAPAQNQNQIPITIQRPQLFGPLRPYAPQFVPPVRLNNSTRLDKLIRAGNLYLSVQDAIALAIENNLNLEIARYGPLVAQSQLDRARAGGPLRGVPSASQQVTSVTSGAGVNGAAAAAGVGGGGGGGGGGGNGNSTIQQVGAITPNLDPVLQSTMTFSHLSQPQANTVLSQTNALIQSIHAYNTTIQEGTLTGGTFQYRNFEQGLSENAPSDNLNPISTPRMDLIFRQNLLQGFGTTLNNRGIRIAGVNTQAALESFRSQLLNLVASVQNLYWDVVAARDELELRRRALEITEKFRDDTKYEISVGALAGVELPRAEAELASRRNDVVIAQGNLDQRSVLLKEALSHTADAGLEAAQIIPVDRIEVADTEELPAVRDLIATAMAKRPDVAISKYNDQTTQMNLIGTANPLLPSLQAIVTTYNRGASGAPQRASNQYFEGGYGTSLGQIFRRNFPNEQATLSFGAPLHNRLAQADYGIDQLQYRQGQIRSQKDTNQIVVDVSSGVAAVQQARFRFNTARDARVLQEQLLEAEKKRSSGTTTFNAIMIDQRGLIAAQLSELAAKVTYQRSRIGLDQVLGLTLDRNNITLEEGLKGKVDRESNPATGIEQTKNRQ